MVATTAFSFGIDANNCRHVIHVDGSYDICSYVQAAGRAGRDGNGGTSTVLLCGNSLETSDKEFTDFVNSSQCRSIALSAMMDSRELQFNSTCGVCDNCLARSKPKQTIPDELLKHKIIHRVAGETASMEYHHAVEIIRRANTYGKRLKVLMEKGVCLSCMVMDPEKKVVKHNIRTCPHWKYSCYTCGDGNERRSCRYETVLKEHSIANKLCSTCALPAYVHDTTFHAGNDEMGACCKWKDSAWHATLLMYRRRRIGNFIPNPPVQQSFEDFVAWCCESSHGINNVAVLMFGLIESHERFNRR